MARSRVLSKLEVLEEKTDGVDLHVHLLAVRTWLGLGSFFINWEEPGGGGNGDELVLYCSSCVSLAGAGALLCSFALFVSVARADTDDKAWRLNLIWF